MSKRGPTVAGLAKKRASSSSHSRVGGRKSSNSSAVRESSGELIAHILQMSKKTGINREVVFKKGASRKIYAYYVLPSDPSKVVREDAEGNQFVGRVTNGKFRVLRSITVR